MLGCWCGWISDKSREEKIPNDTTCPGAFMNCQNIISAPTLYPSGGYDYTCALHIHFLVYNRNIPYRAVPSNWPIQRPLTIAPRSGPCSLGRVLPWPVMHHPFGTSPEYKCLFGTIPTACCSTVQLSHGRALIRRSSDGSVITIDLIEWNKSIHSTRRKNVND